MCGPHELKALNPYAMCQPGRNIYHRYIPATGCSHYLECRPRVLKAHNPQGPRIFVLAAPRSCLPKRTRLSGYYREETPRQCLACTYCTSLHIDTSGEPTNPADWATLNGMHAAIHRTRALWHLPLCSTRCAAECTTRPPFSTCRHGMQRAHRALPGKAPEGAQVPGHSGSEWLARQ